LAARGQHVRFWVDDPAPLRWMAPQGAEAVELRPWTDPLPPVEPGDVVVELFGCDPPPDFVARMRARSRPPQWINLEHLSAEGYVERSHGLPSPHPAGLVKRFFFPGFTPRTGGLLREPGLIEDRIRFERDPWLAAHGLALRPGERLVTLFCYDTAPAAALLEALAGAPTLLVLTPGAAQRLVGPLALPASVRAVALDWLPQPGYDRLLWSADLNAVRGEDSIVRAIWAGVPFLWQLYPQHDGVHEAKLEAFAARFDAARVPGLQACWRRWNGFGSGPLELPLAPPAWPAWQAACRAFRDVLAGRDDLTTQLLRAVAPAG
jgi:uncharacterized repeat protein (TIGR03837 family)